MSFHSKHRKMFPLREPGSRVQTSVFTAGEVPRYISQVLPEGAERSGQGEASQRRCRAESGEEAETGQRQGGRHRGQGKGEAGVGEHAVT